MDEPSKAIRRNSRDDGLPSDYQVYSGTIAFDLLPLQ